jgi:hypothetical protein
MRKLNIDVYTQVKDKGLLGRMQFLVYETLCLFGPLTQMELSRLLASPDRSNVGPRFAELKKYGCIYESEHRNCAITGKLVTEWDVTSAFPNKKQKSIKPKQSNKKRNSTLLNLLQFSIRDLQKQVKLGRFLTKEECMWLTLAQQESIQLLNTLQKKKK